MLGIVGAFVYLFLASLALGMAFGLGIAFLLKLLRSRDSPQVRPALRVQECTPRGSVMLPEPSISPKLLQSHLPHGCACKSRATLMCFWRGALV